MRVRLFAISLAFFTVTDLQAQCIDVVDVATELPHNIVTPNGTSISYFYNLESEQYLLLWSRGEQSGGPYGPYTLTRACAPAQLRWENDRYLLLEAGCGTFCWEVAVIPLAPGGAEDLKIMRPLAFDAERSLLAFYADKDIIRVRNLLTGREQDIRTAYECDSYSGLCFQDLRFVGNELQYVWRYDPAGPILTAPLDASVTTE